MNMKKTFIVTLSEQMMKRIASEVKRNLEEKYENIYDLTNEQIALEIDEVSIVKHNWYCSEEETEKIFQLVLNRLYE